MLQLLSSCTKNKLMKIIPYSSKLIFLLPLTSNELSSIKNYSENKSNKSNSDDDKLPEPPTNCCMAGCANCVWVDYAEKLIKHFKDGGEKARKKILEHVTDENMRAFLMFELRILEKKNKK